MQNVFNEISAGNLENLAQNTDVRAGSFSEEGYTLREMNLIRAMAEGLPNKEIASRLFITEGKAQGKIILLPYLAKENLSHCTALAVYYLTGRKQD